MNEQFQERRNIFLALVGLILILLIVLFFAVLKPMMDEKNAEQASALEAEKNVKDLQLEKKRLDNNKVSTEDQEFLYEKKMPLNPSLDELMRSLEEIAAVSMSRIDKIEFAYDGELPLPEADKKDVNVEVETPAADASTDAAGDSTDTDKTNVKVETNTDEQDKAISPESTALAWEAPENLHTITMRMEVASPNYQSFDTLMKEVEKLERVTLLNTMEFKKPAEAELVLNENPDESVICTVELMTFYYDGPVDK